MKIALFLYAAVICVSAAIGFPTSIESVPPQCADPTFACQDIKNARLCGVVKSCINDIWSTMSAPDDNDDICSICKEMVKEARDQLLSNMTQEELKEVFEGSCKLIPVKLIAEGCIKIVDEFIPELVEMLASRMDPNMVCTVSGLCNVAHLSVLRSNDELTCEFCTHVFQHIKDLVTSNTTVEEFRTALLNFCKHTGRFSTKCTDFVNKNYDTVFGFIRNLDAKGFCTVLGLCSNQLYPKKYVPLTKLVPPSVLHKSIPLIRLVPARPVERTSESVKLQVKSNQIDVESNDIFAPSNQLPIDRLTHPSIVLSQNIDCSFCKAIAFYLKQDLAGDRSKAAVEKALGNVCHKWVKEFPEECKAVINKYSLHMKHRIVDGANFDDICFFAKACPLEEVTGLKVRVVTPKNSSSMICDLCKDVCDEIETQLKDPSTKKFVDNLLNQACNYLPKSIRDDCRNFIDENLDTVFNILEEELNGDNLCPAIRLCPGSGYSKNVPSKNVRDIECDLCKDFVEQLQQRLKDPDVKKSLQNLLERGCAMLPQELASECKNYVDQNIDNLINILVQDMDPNLVCAALNLCQSAQIHVKPHKSNDIECDFCKEVVEKVDEELKDQRTEEKIKEALDKACTYLPTSLTAKCEHFVNTYSTLLISLLAQEMDPQLICSALKLCPDSLRQSKIPKVKGIECDLCKEIVSKLDSDLKDKRTVDEIKAALKDVCSYLPSSYSDKCENFINANTDMLVSLLAAELNPTMVCGALKICPAKMEALQEWKLKVKSLECAGCQYFFHYIQNELMDANAQKRIKAAIKKVCKFFPKVYDENCEAYVDEFGSAFLALIAQDIDPSIVCVKLSVCSPENVTAITTHFSQGKQQNMDECSLCTSVVDYLDKLLEDDDVDKEITVLVEKVCTIVPATLKEQCSSLIESYGPYILQMIGQLADSKQVCQDIDMCSRTPGHVHLLGGKKCTFGPSYWCQSKVHASACKAEMYCKEKVWGN